ncbi:hypothetical protein [Flavobacterium sp.]|uniref:hypothetical protein n=1 Tax=Flavobacterium sp. TaxID=239 RepID=UPI0025D795B0|nr:hypothetical protein [Flavobacterium sp.]
MKKCYLLFSLALLSFTNTTDPVDRIGVKEPLKFNEISYTLSWSEHPKDYYYIQEYLPQNETFEHFNQMLTLHVFDKDVTAEAAMQQKVKELEIRKKTDKLCNYQVTESPDGTEFVVDFLLSQNSGDKLAIVEFNTYRYKKVPIGTNKKGILVYAYTKRSYGDDITDFMKKLGDDRSKMLYALRTLVLPQILIQ